METQVKRYDLHLSSFGKNSYFSISKSFETFEDLSVISLMNRSLQKFEDIILFLSSNYFCNSFDIAIYSDDNSADNLELNLLKKFTFNL